MGQAAVRNLLILHTPTAQGLSDWVEVKGKIQARAPDIEVRIANNVARNSVTRRWQVSRPSLVFSASPLLEYQPAGGKIYAGRRLAELAKEEELHRLHDAGLPVPETLRFTPDLRLAGEPWGDYVVVKPVAGYRGKGIRLVRTEDLSRRYSELTVGGLVSMLVQSYIDHVDAEGCPSAYRVITLFGHEVFASYRSWIQPRRPLAEIAADPAGIIATNDTSAEKFRRFCHEEDVIALARSVYRAFPEIPVLGIDIIRETATGRLVLMECNPSGYVWHFSSNTGQELATPEYRQGMYEQFSALDRAAELLIQKTRLEAI
ncbi:MAG: hypothetical protein WD871_13210 [Xanthobacteraceae bacterium]